VELDGFIAIILMLLHWRVAFSFFAGVLLAIALVNALPWFNGLQGAVVAVLGFVLGAYWEDAARRLRSETSAKVKGSGETKPFTMHMLAVVVAAFWGVFSATSTESFLAGAMVFVLVAWGWYKYTARENVMGSRDQVVISVLLAGLVYPLAAALGNRVIFGS
jgi:hypothetical protein